MRLKLSIMTPTKRFTTKKLPTMMKSTKKKAQNMLLSRTGCMPMSVASMAAIMTSAQPSVVEISNSVSMAAPTLLKFCAKTGPHSACQQPQRYSDVSVVVGKPSQPVPSNQACWVSVSRFQLIGDTRSSTWSAESASKTSPLQALKVPFK